MGGTPARNAEFHHLVIFQQILIKEDAGMLQLSLLGNFSEMGPERAMVEMGRLYIDTYTHI